jgi:hypothetical protein
MEEETKMAINSLKQLIRYDLGNDKLPETGLTIIPFKELRNYFKE